ncbi:MAG TPA: hypothetical protein VLU95_09125 [Candidatus Acidoferrum sp.]|nr:hypothetical protein [Candidatus Acidoferrum sp.]
MKETVEKLPIAPHSFFSGFSERRRSAPLRVFFFYRFFKVALMSFQVRKES